ncbi:IS5 family transposase [Microbacterium sp. MM2322]|uniref:IS5 family transposase n=1 Tax=Microbacterium sp. MM2322 TaxID=3157631 RepID=UPI0032D583CD
MGRRFRAPQGAPQNYKKFGDEPPDHAIGRSRGGLTTKNHLVCDGKGRALAFILTPGQTADTIMLGATLEQIRVPAGRGRPRPRPDRVMADKGYPSRANRAWLRTRGIAATIPERDDQITHRRKRRGRPIDFGDEQRSRYRGRNVVERCFNKLKQWRGIAMRSDKLARNYHAGLCLASTLHWLSSRAIISHAVLPREPSRRAEP